MVDAEGKNRKMLQLTPAALHTLFTHPPAAATVAAPAPCCCRLGDVVSAVVDMAEGGQRPDRFTFSAIFNACQRADEAELALDVARSANSAAPLQTALSNKCCRDVLPRQQLHMRCSEARRPAHISLRRRCCPAPAPCPPAPPPPG